MNNKICIDFGGENLKIHHNQFGVVFNEKSLLAAEKRGKKYAIIKTGTEASKFLEENHENIVVFSPISEGVIQSVEYAAALLKRALYENLNRKHLKNALAIISVPSGISTSQKSDFIKVCKLCGLRNINIADAPISTLLGANEFQPEDEVLVIDLGASKCDFQILKNFNVKVGATLGLGSNSIKNALQKTLWEDEQFWPNPKSLNKIQEELCTLHKSNAERLEVTGIYFPQSEEITKSMSAQKFFPITNGFFNEVVLVAKTLINEYQTNSNSSIQNILLAGGLAKTIGLEKFFLKHFPNTKIVITEDPENANLRGLITLMA